jgi:hypothetical protein
MQTDLHILLKLLALTIVVSSSLLIAMFECESGVNRSLQVRSATLEGV